VRCLRLRELTNTSRLAAVGVGMATVLPRQLLCLLSPFDMELRTSGLPTVDLNFLKVRSGTELLGVFVSARNCIREERLLLCGSAMVCWIVKKKKRSDLIQCSMTLGSQDSLKCISVPIAMMWAKMASIHFSMYTQSSLSMLQSGYWAV
jgi:hypothetical protein